MPHTYAIDASTLLESCLQQVSDLLCVESCGKRQQNREPSCLQTLHNALTDCYDSLYEYLVDVIEEEKENCELDSNFLQENGNSTCFIEDASLLNMADRLKEILLLQQKCHRHRNQNLHSSSYNAYNVPSQHPSLLYGRSRDGMSNSSNTVGSLLFRLTVILQLCLVRIDDARLALTGRRLKDMTISSDRQMQVAGGNDTKAGRQKKFRWILGVSLAATTYFPIKWNSAQYLPNSKQSRDDFIETAVATIAQWGTTAVLLYGLNWNWSTLWMKNKVNNSTREVQSWVQQWKILCYKGDDQQHSLTSKQRVASNDRIPIQRDDSVRTQQLINYALENAVQGSPWQSQGDLQFLIIRRAMEVFYASVGTAVNYTGGDTNKVMSFSKTMATAAAASFYYTITGASRRANEFTSSAKSARDLIQNAWGVVSLPGVKELSLQASRLLKGAAVADRIEIAGVQCFVLSSDPSPELAAAIARSKRRLHSQHHRQRSSSTAVIPRLSTIDEEEGSDDEGDEESLMSSSQSSVHSSTLKPFARCPISYRQRDVILHFTGGGFFAHIIASDLPYLLDWSAATGAVIVCPEYALLPQHTFPVALDQVERVYRTLIGEKIDASSSNLEDSDSMTGPSLLGFEVNQIAITGESTGGNLAAALCVKIARETKQIVNDDQKIVSNETVNSPLRDIQSPATTSRLNATIKISSENKKKDDLQDGIDIGEPTSTRVLFRRMPDALMLSCPVLNLSLEMSHSRAIGTNDPVLPSGLLSAISDAYLPCEQLGIDKKFPLASPVYASNDVLSEFPNTLIFASSTDPLLDDSVVFNQRLRYVGVQSELYAAQNLPHAYLGLGTAGFPEARQVQERCIHWLNQQLGQHRK